MRTPPRLACVSAWLGAWRRAACLLAALVSAVLAAWAWSWAGPAWRDAAGLPDAWASGPGPRAGAWLLTGLIAALAAWVTQARLPKLRHRLHQLPDGRWLLEQVGRRPRAGRIDLMLDLGPWLLLRFSGGAGQACWLPLTLPGQPLVAARLRAALVGGHVLVSDPEHPR